MQISDYFKLSFIITRVNNLEFNLGVYLELCFIMIDVGNLDAKVLWLLYGF